MSNTDFRKLLDNSLKPLQQGQEELKKGQEELRKSLGEVKKDLKEIKNTQEERVLPSLTYVETTVKSYADRYVTNEDHIRRLDKRLNTVEGNLGIYPPTDLSIPPAE